VFGVFGAGDEDGGQFVSFVHEVFHSLGREYPGFNGQFQPTQGLLKFLQSAFNLTDKPGS